jgi:predicted nucleotidyltransferase
MKDEVRRITTALNEASVRYVVAGGLAVVAHGYLRMTMDVDLVIDLERDNLLRALHALERVGYKPRLPVAMEQFADAGIRESWINEKHMLVFPLWNPADENGVVVDVFVKCPFDFADEYARAKWMEFDGQRVPFVGLDCLLKMKAAAARPKDLADIEYLKKAQNETSAEP